jgi:hypothetical protein
VTDDDTDARFDKITGGEELNDLRGTVPPPLRRAPRSPRYYAGKVLLAVAVATAVGLALWFFGLAYAWLAGHGMLAASN